jgi:hypothetical protein
VRIPNEAGAGIATTTLRYPEGKGVAPATIQFIVPERK